MSKQTFRISLGILTVVIGALIAMNILVRADRGYEAVYQNANSAIEWTGAGYSGIYARQGGGAV